MRARFSFGNVSPAERRAAELFYAALVGRPRRATIGRTASEAAESLYCVRHDRRPTVFEALCWREAYFQFVPITTSFTNSSGEYGGTFWVLDDALKWIVPESFSSFVESYDPMTAKVQNWTRSPSRRRNWRLPCTPQEAQQAAAMVRMRQADLPGARAAPSGTGDEVSLLLTPKLTTSAIARRT
jgi:hypothetical protein